MSVTQSTHNQPEYSVSEVSGALKRVVEDHFSYVRIRGEISGFKRAASGHCYLDLKDDKAVMNAVCWKGNAAKLAFKPEDGLEVVATGKISTYPGRSNYQLVIDKMEPAGAGALMALLEKRKQQLAAEGLFAQERKQPLPFMPQRIGVVTSPTGAVIRDILHRLQERYPTQVQIWPVRVQGEGAAEEITAAIEGFQTLTPAPELIIVARGGGSIEDLWCFNEENVVRAAAASRIPLISAVGHETDVTLIDYVADKRAPTPTAAAEIAVPVRREWMLTLNDWQNRMHGAMHQRLSRQQERVQGLARAIPSPAQLLQYASQRLDDWHERLSRGLPQRISTAQQQLFHASARLSLQPIMQQLQLNQQRLQQQNRLLDHSILQKLQQQTQRLELPATLLESLNYKQVLKRGFTLVRAADGGVVSSANAAKALPNMQLIFADGELQVHPTQATPAPTKTKPAKRTQPSNSTPSKQTSLFDT